MYIFVYISKLRFRALFCQVAKNRPGIRTFKYLFIFVIVVSILISANRRSFAALYLQNLAQDSIRMKEINKHEGRSTDEQRGLIHR